MANKWICANGKLKIASAIDCHSELLSVGDVCVGGGIWHESQAERYLLLYGESSDFGKCDILEVIKSIQSGFFSTRFEGYELLFSLKLSLELAIKYNTKITIL